MNRKYFLAILLFIVNNSYTCKCSNILVILPITLRSHLNVFNTIVDVLATEHQITFYSIHEQNKNHENITERKITNPFMKKNRFDLFYKLFQSDQFYQFLLLMKHFDLVHFDTILKENDINSLINSNEKYDLMIIVNILSEPLFKLAHIFDVPLIQVVTSIPLPWNYAQLNNHNNLGYDISFLTAEESYTFTQRVTKFLKHLYTWYYFEWVYLPPLEKLTQKYFPANSPTINEIAQNTEALLVNYIGAMGYTRSNPANVLEIGGLHCKPPKQLSTNLEEFMFGSGEHGVIYFSLGSTVSDLVLSSKIKSNMINVFKKLPQRILWKLDEEIKDLPENIMISKWFPQQDILGHNKTKLFITQGGMLSLQEATYHGVQVLILPLIGDQFSNGYLAQRKGYAKVLTLDRFSEDVFYNNIQELIYNSSYREKVTLLSSAIKDQPISTADKLKHYIKYIINHRNATTLRPMTNHLSLVEQMELDIYVFIIIIFFVIIYGLYKFLYIVKTFVQRKIKIKVKLL